jgi:hypothetical protein
LSPCNIVIIVPPAAARAKNSRATLKACLTRRGEKGEAPFGKIIDSFKIQIAERKALAESEFGEFDIV